MRSKKTNYPRATIILFTIVCVCLAFFAFRLISQSKKSTSSNSSINETNIPNFNQYIETLPRATYASPQGNYTVHLNPTPQSGSITSLVCNISLLNSENSDQKLPSELKKAFECFYNPAINELITPFRGWINDQLFLFETAPGTILITNAETTETDTFTFDPQLFFFSAVDNTHSYWLMQHLPIEKNQFTIVNQQFQTLIERIDLKLPPEGQFWTADTEYDPINQGFVFVIRQAYQAPGKPQPALRTAAYVKFFNPNTQQTQTLYQTNLSIIDPEKEPLCTASTFEFQPGQIIVTPGCVAIPESDLNPDGKLILKVM